MKKKIPFHANTPLLHTPHTHAHTHRWGVWDIAGHGSQWTGTQHLHIQHRYTCIRSSRKTRGTYVRDTRVVQYSTYILEEFHNTDKLVNRQLHKRHIYKYWYMKRNNDDARHLHLHVSTAISHLPISSLPLPPSSHSGFRLSLSISSLLSFMFSTSCTHVRNFTGGSVCTYIDKEERPRPWSLHIHHPAHGMRQNWKLW